MLTPDTLESLPYSTIKLYRQLEDYILADISRRIAKAGYITDTAEWQILRIKELGEAADNIKKEISRITQLSEKEIEQLFFDSAQMSTSFYDDIYKASGLPPVPLAENKSLMQLLDAGIKQTNQELYNFTQSLGFAVDVAGQTVFKPIAKVYQDTLDFAQFQVSSGAADYITATRQAVKKLADSGIRFVDYKTGWVNRSDVAVRRATLTGIGQITGKISEQAANDLDTDIVETTAHSGARPDHKLWQGKWFSLSGKSTKYPSLEAVTGYGTGAGLKGWNCRHDFYPVVPGISKPAYSDEDLKNIDPPPFEYEGKTYTAYEASQQQRIIETAMRKSKRELIGFDASGDKEAFTTSSIKLRRQRELYSEFSKKAGLKTQLERTQVLDFDRGKAQKAAWNAKKAVDNKVESGIIKKINYAKADEFFQSSNKHLNSELTPQSIFEELQKSEIGRSAVKTLEDMGVKPNLIYSRQYHTNRGDQHGGIINIYIPNIKNDRVAAQTIIHETSHLQYGIGKSQWAEAVCMAKEKMHIANKTTLTIKEKRYIVELAKRAYPEYNWKKGGYLHGRRK